MDIRIGETPVIGKAAEKAVGQTGAIEARVLAIRSPRRRASDGRVGQERRAPDERRDPLTGRVLVLLIPDGSGLPDGLASGEFRVFLRFVRR